MAVVEGERGPGGGVAIGRRLLIDAVLGVVVVIELRRLAIVVVRVRMVVRPDGVVVVEVDRQRERGAVGPVSVVGAVTRQVAHRSDDPAEHERGELNDCGLLTRAHARGILLPIMGDVLHRRGVCMKTSPVVIRSRPSASRAKRETRS